MWGDMFLSIHNKILFIYGKYDAYTILPAYMIPCTTLKCARLAYSVENRTKLLSGYENVREYITYYILPATSYLLQEYSKSLAVMMHWPKDSYNII